MASSQDGNTTPATDSASGKKYRRVMARIRAQITSGELAPGTQLPSWDEIGDAFGVSRITVQRAMSELRRAGFVQSRRRSGSFVSSHPPDLFRFAVVFGADDLNVFRRGLVHHVEQRQRDTDEQFEIYRGMERAPQCAAYDQLMQRIDGAELAGMILSVPKPVLDRLPALKQTQIPKITIATDPHPELDTICIDPGNTWIARALSWLGEQGRTRVAAMASTSRLEQYVPVFEQMGLPTPSHWMVPADIRHPTCGRALAELLLRLPAQERPDALVVGHDALIEHVQAGLVAGGVAVPEDLAVVAQCAWPRLVPSVLPIRWLGYDLAELVDAALSCLQGKTAVNPGSEPTAYRLTPRFEQAADTAQ